MSSNSCSSCSVRMTSVSIGHVVAQDTRAPVPHCGDRGTAWRVVASLPGVATLITAGSSCVQCMINHGSGQNVGAAVLQSTTWCLSARDTAGNVVGIA